jgi:hypothetical protein
MKDLEASSPVVWGGISSKMNIRNTAGTAGSHHNSQHSRVKGFHTSYPVYAVLPKEFGIWPQGSMLDY